MPMYRQGDVLLVPMPDYYNPKSLMGSGRIQNVHDGVLAHGELTGHAHRIKDTTNVTFLSNHPVWSAAAERFITVAQGATATLEHEEHAPITIEAGTYKVEQQQQYDPSEAARRRAVAD